MGAFTAIVTKDLKEILVSRFFVASLVGGLAALVILGVSLNMAVSSAKTPAGKFAVVVNKTTELGLKYSDLLKSLGGEIYDNFTPDLLDKYDFVVIVPENFSLPAEVEVYARYKGLLSLGVPPVLNYAAAELASEIGLPSHLVNVSMALYIDGVKLNEAEAASLLGLFLFSFIFMLLVPLIVASTAAIAMGLEKEKRTFELILSTPATPSVLIWAKLVSTLILALIQYSALAVGLLIYFTNLSRATSQYMPPGAGSAAITTISPSIAASILASTLALSVFLLVISFLVATKSEDIRTAQSVGMLVILPFVLPSFAALFLPPRALEVYPFLHPMASAYSALAGRWDRVLLYLLEDWGMAIASLIVALKVITAEFLITGRLRR